MKNFIRLKITILKKISDSEYYEFISKILNDYFDNNYKMDINRYIFDKISFLLGNNDYLREDLLLQHDTVSELISMAKKGDKFAREQLICHYMYFIERCDNLTEDSRQEGYYYLVKLIDNYIQNPIDTQLQEYIANRFNSLYYKKMLENKDAQVIYLESVPDFKSSKEFNDSLDRFEFDDILSKMDLKEATIRTLGCVINGCNNSDIAICEGVSDTAIISRLSGKKLQKQLKNIR